MQTLKHYFICSSKYFFYVTDTPKIIDMDQKTENKTSSGTLLANKQTLEPVIEIMILVTSVQKVT